MIARSSPFVSWLAAATLGGISVFGFAPFGLAPLPLLTLALLFLFWLRAPSPRAAAALGFAFGLGWFLCGTSWVYVSLHTFGGMPAWLTAISTFAFCAVLAGYPAFVGWLAARAGGDSVNASKPHAGMLQLLVAMPACWTIGEMLRARL